MGLSVEFRAFVRLCVPLMPLKFREEKAIQEELKAAEKAMFRGDLPTMIL